MRDHGKCVEKHCPSDLFSQMTEYLFMTRKFFQCCLRCQKERKIRMGQKRADQSRAEWQYCKEVPQDFAGCISPCINESVMGVDISKLDGEKNKQGKSLACWVSPRHKDTVFGWLVKMGELCC